MKRILKGNYAAAHAVKLCKAQVIAAYPITPQTTIIEGIADIIDEGKLDAKFIKVESEHSAMAACIGAASAGSRTFTATSSHGLLLMNEMIHWAAGARLPIVACNVNRAIGPGWNIWTDQNDSLSMRDTGWMQFYCQTSQEVMDSVIQAYKISERLLLPSMIVMDAFFLSHTSEVIDEPDPKKVDAFLPPWKAEFKLDTNKPGFFGAIVSPDNYMEFRYLMHEGQEKALDVIEEVGQEYGRMFGRPYGLLEEYRTEGADTLFVTSATPASTARAVIDELREKGHKVGLVRLRVFRPFPGERVRQILGKAEKVAILDRDISYGMGGIWAQEVRNALFPLKGEAPIVQGYIAGIGGRDITTDIIREIILETEDVDQDRFIVWKGLKPKGKDAKAEGIKNA
ncbi:MAG: pyruvate ferredoxin oxidoreductase [Deltaproteobacteria bacterium]|nr:pyruvate ferredoxin oxidoreductase [Deltaproteobacteria bacterium]